MQSWKWFAKIILFWEHFVVYWLPWIASGINKYVKAEIKKIKKDDIVFVDKIFWERLSQKEHPKHIVSRLFKAMFGDLNLSWLQIAISSNFAPKAGMWYSAAFNTAIARAINWFLKLNRDDKKINDIAFSWETIIHWTASWIDNTCSTLWSLIYFQKDLKNKHNKISRLQSAKELILLQVDSNIKHNTKQSVELVKKNKERNPDLFNSLFRQEKIILKQAKQAIEKWDLKKIWLLMNKNHDLLRQIWVSCKTLEKLIQIALDNWALWAKLTGAWMWWSIIALCKDTKQQNIISNIYKKLWFNCIKIKVK